MSNETNNAPEQNGPTLYQSNQQIATMVDMVDGMFEIPNETKLYMASVRGICAQAARELTGLATVGVKLDQGQMNAAIQLLQQVKDKACCAALLGSENHKRAAERAAVEASSDAKRRKEQ